MPSLLNVHSIRTMYICQGMHTRKEGGGGPRLQDALNYIGVLNSRHTHRYATPEQVADMRFKAFFYMLVHDHPE